MTALNRVKTTPLQTEQAITQDNVTTLQKSTCIPNIYKLIILILHTIINIALFVFIFIFSGDIPLLVKDTMVPIQYLKNVEIIFEILRFKSAKENIFSSSVYPNFFVGIALYVYHVKKLNTELDRYMKNLPTQLAFDVNDHKGQTDYLLKQLKNYEEAEKKETEINNTYVPLTNAIRAMETELTAVYSAYGYTPYGILHYATYEMFENNPAKLRSIICRLVTIKPQEGYRAIYEKIEQYFNTLLQDPYVSFALQLLQKNLEEVVKFKSLANMMA